MPKFKPSAPLVALPGYVESNIIRGLAWEYKPLVSRIFRS
jgi:hypothetical protein